jgi:multiple antibiotic resistance protein
MSEWVMETAMLTDAIAAVEIDPQRIFVLFFLMLGPVKILAPFVEMTRQSDPATRRRLANRAIMLSAAALFLSAALGDTMIANFDIPLPVLALAAGLILFLVALRTILQQFAPPPPAQTETSPPSSQFLVGRLAFPTIVTPYGIAAVIVFCVLAKNDPRMLIAIVGLMLLVLLLDWLAMLFAAPILSWGHVPLQLFAVILGVIQVSLGLQLMLRGLDLSGVLPLPSS